jgi:hypothetical protein
MNNDQKYEPGAFGFTPDLLIIELVKQGTLLRLYLQHSRTLSRIAIASILCNSAMLSFIILEIWAGAIHI